MTTGDGIAAAPGTAPRAAPIGDGVAAQARSRLVPALTSHAVLAAGALLMIYPLLWLLVSSLKTDAEIFANASSWPKSVQFDDYLRGWRGTAMPFATFFKSSFLISIAAVIGNVLACSLVAFAFAR